ncbi:enoyl-CoA hydratase/isomerase family protein [Ensifer adhaerens]|uniref:enoyl-CoA hydratase/isomerase family protein n=1 Tax=Ensifer adhaerens TaxID=106592 RepID=UPI001F1D467A|nr:enoyl-CoA hydratase-related protein [Ensifer adhaerens]
METFEDGKIALTIGRVARLKINRPDKRNAMNRAMWRGITEACGRLSEHPEVRVVVFGGVGPHFCSGADISEFAETYASDATAEQYNSGYRAAETVLRNLSVPVIAEIRGACLGGGLGLALSADLRFSDETAKIAVTASKLGISYSAEDCARLIEKIGVTRTKDMLLSARTIASQEALSWGLVDRVVAPEGLTDLVDSYAEDLAARSRASLRAMKFIINAIAEPNAKLCDELRATYSQLFRGPDLVEGAKAFLQKREPVFD